MKRLLLLTDDELTVLVSWAEVAGSVSALVGAIPDEIIAHDFNEEDEGVLEKIEAARLR